MTIRSQPLDFLSSYLILLLSCVLVDKLTVEAQLRSHCTRTNTVLVTRRHRASINTFRHPADRANAGRRPHAGHPAHDLRGGVRQRAVGRPDVDPGVNRAACTATAVRHRQRQGCCQSNFSQSGTTHSQSLPARSSHVAYHILSLILGTEFSSCPDDVRTSAHSTLVK